MTVAQKDKHLESLLEHRAGRQLHGTHGEKDKQHPRDRDRFTLLQSGAGTREVRGQVRESTGHWGSQGAGLEGLGGRKEGDRWRRGQVEETTGEQEARNRSEEMDKR